MKTFRTLLLCSLASGLSFTAANAQDADSTGLPGDQFSLAAALDLFKKASSPEEFEKLLNTEGNDANNLDLNEDGQTDYVKVIDKKEGDLHVLVLQVAVSETEDQDIAVIELEKTGESTAVLQIVGDEDIFGEETIVEPSEESTSNLHNGSGPEHGPAFNEYNGIIVNVWLWPSVRYVYAPAYVVWRSPFRWRAHPVWWRPWRPVSYAVFRPRRVVYGPRYTVVSTRRVARARVFYRPARVTSVTVTHRHSANVASYRATRKTTTISGPRGKYPARQPLLLVRAGIRSNVQRQKSAGTDPGGNQNIDMAVTYNLNEGTYVPELRGDMKKHLDEVAHSGEIIVVSRAKATDAVVIMSLTVQLAP